MNVESTREELARLLPAPDYPDLPADRHRLLKDDLMTSLRETAPVRRRRPGLLIGVATPLVLAAGAAFAIVSMSSSPVVRPGPAPTAIAVKSSPGVRLTDYIKTSSYVLQREPGDMIKVTVRADGGKPDGAGLKEDLARMGVTVQIYDGFPDCTPQIINLAQRDKNGDFVATITVKLLTDYPEAIVFADNASDADAVILSIGTGDGPTPTCGPVPPLPAGHTPVAETTVD